VDPSRGAAWTQIVVLGGTLATLGLLTDGIYALLGGTAGDWLKRKNASARFRRAQRYVSGGVYLALGAAAAATGPGKD
jgi:threonine/homoserine/homoserine lactone efflux protein